MVFRFKPMKEITNPTSDWSQPIGDKLLSQVIKSQMKSTYASDFVNNVEEKAKYEERTRQLASRPVTAAGAARWRTSVRNSADPVYPQFQYNVPFNYESVNLAPTRYGCNKFFTKKAVGIVPDCSRYWINNSGIN
jgi:hypothetical protein